MMTERVKTRGLARSAALAGSIVMFSSLFALEAYGNPEGGRVVGGSAEIRATAPTRLDVIQHSDRAVIDWQRFSIAPDEHTHFDQPSSRSVTLNRVVGRDLSTIAGRLTADGNVFLINPAGILFTETARVDVGGLVATTASIGTEDFMAGRLDFAPAGQAAGSVVNHGDITIAEGGLAAFVAPWVANQGAINARVGRIDLAAGDAFTLDLYGDGLVRLALEDHSAIAQAANSGLLSAEGGVVTMTAAEADAAVVGVVNSGIIEARSVEQRGGRIVLSGGSGHAAIGGIVDTSGAEGGAVVVGGATVEIDDALVDASGSAGGGTIAIGGGIRGAAPMAGMPNSEITVVSADAHLRADAIDRGAGGTITVWGDVAARIDGNATARGGAAGGDGGFVELSSRGAVGLTGSISTDAPGGEDGLFLLDPRSITIRERDTAPRDPFSFGDPIPPDGVVIPRDESGPAPPDNVDDWVISVGNFRSVKGSIRLEAEDFISVEVPVDLPNQTAGESFELDAGNIIRLEQGITTAGADVVFTAGSIVIGSQSPVVVRTDGGDATFDGLVDGDGSGGSILDVAMGAGTARFTKAVGSRAPLAELGINRELAPLLLEPRASDVFGDPGDTVPLIVSVREVDGSFAGGPAPALLLQGLPVGSTLMGSTPGGDDRSRLVDASGIVDVSDLNLDGLVLQTPREGGIFPLTFSVVTPSGGLGTLEGPPSLKTGLFLDGTARDQRQDDARFVVRCRWQRTGRLQAYSRRLSTAASSTAASSTTSAATTASSTTSAATTASSTTSAASSTTAKWRQW